MEEVDFPAAEAAAVEAVVDNAPCFIILPVSDILFIYAFAPVAQ